MNEQLDNILLGTMYAIVSEDFIEHCFPHYEKPSLMEMSIVINRLCRNRPIADYMEAKLSSKPTKEMLDDYCKERNLKYRRNNDRTITFMLKEFPKK